MPRDPVMVPLWEFVGNLCARSLPAILTLDKQVTSLDEYNSFPKGQPSRSDSRNNPACELPEEHFVAAEVASTFLAISRKYLLKLSRLHIVPAHPIGVGSRRQWRYRISELAEWALAQKAPRPDNDHGSPRAPRERRQ
jgi:hypothetical protein